jgi:tRNA G10  N-methylase Trm11
MNQYLLTLGRTPKLSLAELKEVLIGHEYEIVWTSEKHVYIETKSPLDSKSLIHALGGVVKIAEVRSVFSDINKITPEIINVFLQKNVSKITYAISSWVKDLNSDSLAKTVKKELRENGISSRFVLSNNEDGTASVLIKKQNVIEIQILLIKNIYIIAETIAVQEFEEWSRRDYGRPEINPKAGMLPPKVARMMINLAYPIFHKPLANKKQPILLDPFCGVGTIPMESTMMGVKFVASDQSKEMIEKTKKNIEWLKNEYHVSVDCEFYVNDATHVSEVLEHESIDAVITEPFMGPNFETIPTKEHVLQITNGLEKLYVGCLKDWHKIIKTGGRVVIVIPKFRGVKFEISCKKAIDNCENLGYTLLSGPWEYAREQAIVAREIYILEKNNKGVKNGSY